MYSTPAQFSYAGQSGVIWRGQSLGDRGVRPADCDANSRRPATIGLLTLLMLLCATPTAIGHPEGFSGLHITVKADRIQAAITLHTRDLGTWFPPGKYPDYVAEVCREMEQTVAELIELQIDQQPLQAGSVKAFSRDVGLIQIDVDYPLPASAQTVELLVWSKHLIHMPRGHQQLLYVEDRRGSAADSPQGITLLEDVLTVQRDAGAVLLPPLRDSPPKPSTESPEPTTDTTAPPVQTPDTRPSPRRPRAAAATAHPSSRVSYFFFGVQHIITGYDHLLFLAALLLACTTFSEAATIITCFTVAHSITLALAALDVVRLPNQIVEPAIALSIVYVACENLVADPGLWRRAAVTCFFGLVHGLGFAAALREIGLATRPGGIVWPLLKFNLGVEAGQLCVAAILLPLFLFARRNEFFAKRLIPAGSLLVIMLGGYWLATRIMSQFAS